MTGTVPFGISSQDTGIPSRCCLAWLGQRLCSPGYRGQQKYSPSIPTGVLADVSNVHSRIRVVDLPLPPIFQPQRWHDMSSVWACALSTLTQCAVMISIHAWHLRAGSEGMLATASESRAQFGWYHLELWWSRQQDSHVRAESVLVMSRESLWSPDSECEVRTREDSKWLSIVDNAAHRDEGAPIRLSIRGSIHSASSGGRSDRTLTDTVSLDSPQKIRVQETIAS